MTDHLAITRTAEFDLSPDELWALVSDGRRWSDWMVDESDVEVLPGAYGTVIDGDTSRRVEIRTVSTDGSAPISSQLSSWTTIAATRSFRGRVVFEWRAADATGDADDDGTSEASVVELEVTGTGDGGSRLRVVETFVPPTASGSASASVGLGEGFAWDLRLLAMCSCVAVCCRT